MPEQVDTEKEVKTPETVGEKLQGNLQTEGTQPEVASTPTLAERLKGLGFQGVEKDDEAVDRLVAAYEQERKRAAEAETIARALAAERTSPAKEEPQRPAETTNNVWWNPPKVDETLISAFQIVDSNGQRTFRENTPAEVIQQAERLTAHYQKWARDLIEKPDVVLPQIIQSIVEPLIEKKLTTVHQTQKQEEVRDEFIRTNSEWLFTKDPLTGQAGDLSEDGKKFESWLGEAADIGITDYASQIKYANALRAADLAAKKVAARPPPAPAPVEQPVDKKMDLLRRGTNGNPDRGGSFPAPGARQQPPQNRNIRVGDKLADRFREMGVVFK
jgi:hypothetical protein